MGVKNLWQIIHPAASNISLDELNSKVLAIDVNIWIYQFLRSGSLNYSNSSTDSALKIFFHRLCKLLYINTCPVMVFEGSSAPLIKKKKLQLRSIKTESETHKVKQLLKAYINKSLLALNQESPSQPPINDVNFSQQKEHTKLEGSFINSFIEDTHFDQYLKIIPFTGEYDALTSTQKLKCLEYHKKYGILNLPLPNMENADSFSLSQIERANFYGQIINEISDLKTELSNRKIISLGTNFNIGNVNISNPTNLAIKTDPIAINEVIENQCKFNNFESICLPDAIPINSSISIEDTDKNEQISLTPSNEHITPNINPCVDPSTHKNILSFLSSTEYNTDSIHSANPSNDEPDTFISKRVKNIDNDNNYCSSSLFAVNDSNDSTEEIYNFKKFKLNSSVSEKDLFWHPLLDPSKGIDIDTSNFTDFPHIASFTINPLPGTPAMIEQQSSPDMVILSEKFSEPNTLTQTSPSLEYLNKKIDSDLLSKTNFIYEDCFLKDQTPSLILSRLNQAKKNTLKPSKFLTFLFKELSSLFGCFNIESFEEAEAQCAWLAINDLVDGVISDDSDTIVYCELMMISNCSSKENNTTVIRNLFQKKNSPIECYTLEKIRNVLGIDSQVYTALIHLLGSDYNDGVNGIGPVSALGLSALLKDNNIDISELPNILGSLKNNSTEISPQLTKFNAYLKKIKSFPLIFPNLSVEKAYKYPKVHKNTLAKKPAVSQMDINVDGICAFMDENLKWSKETTMRYLEPVLEHRRKLQNQCSTARNLDSYFRYSHTNPVYDKPPPISSKSLASAVNLLLKNKK